MYEVIMFIIILLLAALIIVVSYLYYMLHQPDWRNWQHFHRVHEQLIAKIPKTVELFILGIENSSYSENIINSLKDRLSADSPIDFTYNIIPCSYKQINDQFSADFANNKYPFVICIGDVGVRSIFNSISRYSGNKAQLIVSATGKASNKELVQSNPKHTFKFVEANHNWQVKLDIVRNFISTNRIFFIYSDKIAQQTPHYQYEISFIKSYCRQHGLLYDFFNAERENLIEDLREILWDKYDVVMFVSASLVEPHVNNIIAQIETHSNIPIMANNKDWAKYNVDFAIGHDICTDIGGAIAQMVRRYYEQSIRFDSLESILADKPQTVALDTRKLMQKNIKIYECMGNINKPVEIILK